MKKFLKKNYKSIYIAIVLVAIAVAAVYLFWPKTAVSVRSFAACLSDRGVVMYGLDTCHTCQYQKELFGRDFDNVNYVNCQFNLAECNAKDIEKYPTWIIAGQQYIGAQSLKALSELAGCAL